MWTGLFRRFLKKDRQSSARTALNILYLRDTDRVCGPGKTILNTVRTINRNEYSLIVSSTVRNQHESNAFLKQAERFGATVVPLQMRGWFDLMAAIRLANILYRQHIDLLQTHDAQTRRIGILAALLTGVVHVTSLHGWIQNTFKEELAVRLDKWLIRLTRHIIVMSNQMKKEVLALGVPSSSILVLHNAILLKDYPINNLRGQFRKEFDIANHERLIAAIGRLSPEKGLDSFLAMASMIAKQRRDVKFVVVGEGPLLRGLQMTAANLDVFDKVVFTGYRTDLHFIYADIDILVIPSETEGLPNVMLEAFAFERPVVATNVGGISEILSHGTNGFLVDRGDPESLARYVIQLIDNPHLAGEMGKRGRRTIKEQLSFEVRTRKLEQYYAQQCLHGTRCPEYVRENN